MRCKAHTVHYQTSVWKSGYKQPITLGVDAGSKHVGLSASTEKRELYREEFTPRNDVVDLLSTRRQNRRSRRNRKTRYRLWDKVLYKGQECFVSGRRASGSFTLKKARRHTYFQRCNIQKIAAIRACNKLSDRKDVNGQFLPRLKSRVSLP